MVNKELIPLKEVDYVAVQDVKVHKMWEEHYNKSLKLYNCFEIFLGNNSQNVKI